MTMKMKILALALAFASVTSSASAAEKYLEVPKYFLGDWCETETKNEYRLPSWMHGEAKKCERGFSVSLWDFGAFGENGHEEYCNPTKVKQEQDRAPSGTTYIAKIEARCYPQEVTVPIDANGLPYGPHVKVRRIELSRYKGHLWVK